MPRRPWSKWYWRDWQSDPKLRVCSLAARGLWAEMLAIMDQAEPRGFLLVNGRRPSFAQLARLVGSTEAEVRTLYRELNSHDVFSIDDKRRVYSRRVITDLAKEASAIDFGRRGGNPRLKGKR